MRNPGQCVLVLHRVVEERSAVHDVTWRSFLGLLDLIESLRVVVSRELQPGDSVALTFDDGSEDHLRVAEELARRRLAATFFVPGGALDRRGRLDEHGVRALVSLGHAVGAHGFRHEPFTGLPAATVYREVAAAKERLERILDTRVRLFAPPGGSDHPALQPALRAAGFTASRSARWGFFTAADSRWSIPCIPVTDVTLRYGWIARAIARRGMPASMRAAWMFKQTAPRRLGHVTRAVAHRTR